MSAVVVLILRILVAASLYAFTAFAFYLLWKTLRKATGERQASGVPVLMLQPAEDSGQETHRIEAGEVLVGREKTCGLCLEDETISARHALLSHHNKQWWVEDLGSTNGTFLNLMPVTTPTVLVKGDTVTFGKLNMVVGFEMAK